MAENSAITFVTGPLAEMVVYTETQRKLLEIKAKQ